MGTCRAAAGAIEKQKTVTRKGNAKTLTLKQTEANRRNALQSTGPEGKARASLNAGQHGLLSGVAVLRAALQGIALPVPGVPQSLPAPSGADRSAGGVAPMLGRSPRGRNHIGPFFKTNPYEGGFKNMKTPFSHGNPEFSIPGVWKSTTCFCETKPNERDPSGAGRSAGAVAPMLGRSPRGRNHIGPFFKTNPNEGGFKNMKTPFSYGNPGFSIPRAWESTTCFCETKPNERDPFRRLSGSFPVGGNRAPGEPCRVSRGRASPHAGRDAAVARRGRA